MAQTWAGPGLFGLILATFLKSQSYNFDVIVHTEAPLGVE